MVLELELRDAILRRLSDRAWRLDHIYVILSEDGKIIPFDARPEQRQFRRLRHYRNFVPKARKLGMSTEIVLENLDECIFTPNLLAAIVDKSEADAFAKLNIARFAWEAGPRHPDPAVGWLWAQIHRANPLTTDNEGVLSWSNGSAFEAGVSFTGSTPQRLHISEFGPIAAQKPAKAAEIQRGSINAVPPGGIIDIETTMEGGRVGLCYHYFRLAKESAGSDLSPADWRIHFFSWLGHPSYRLDGRACTDADAIKYFAELSEKYGVDVPPERQAWWAARRRELHDEIWQQYPTVVEECDKALVLGAIYPEMTAVRVQGRVCDFPPEIGPPVFTAWDLGSSDNMAGFLIQPAGKDINVLAWSAGEGKGAPAVAEVIRAWEAQFGRITAHFLPHDANITDKGSGKTYLAQLVEAGILASQIRVVPRTPDVWAGVNEVRKRLPRMWFHSRCDVEVRAPDGQRLPSGIARLEAYRKHINHGTGVVRQLPVKDGVCDHTADALRTFCEADSLGMVVGSMPLRPGQQPEGATARAIMGYRGKMPIGT